RFGRGRTFAAFDLGDSRLADARDLAQTRLGLTHLAATKFEKREHVRALSSPAHTYKGRVAVGEPLRFVAVERYFIGSRGVPQTSGFGPDLWAELVVPFRFTYR